MNTAKRAAGAAFLLAAAGVLDEGYLILTGYSGSYLIWLLPVMPIYAILLWWVNSRFLRAERTVGALTGLNAAFCAVMFAAILVTGGFNGITGLIIAAAMSATPAVLAPKMNLNPPKLSHCILILEASLVLLLLEAGMGIAFSLPSALNACGVFAAVVSLLCLVLYRMDSAVSVRSVALLAGMFAILAVIAMLLLCGGAEMAGGGLVALAQGTAAIGKWLWRVIEAGMRALAALFPQEKMEAVDLELEDVTVNSDGSAEEDNMDPRVGLFLLVAVIIIAAIALIAALILFRKRKLGNLRVADSKEKHTKISPVEAFRRWLADVRRRIAVRAWLRKNKDRPLGLFYLLVRACAGSALARKTEDTPKEFLTRLSRELDAEYSDKILALIPAANRALFSANGDNSVISDAAGICGAASAAARRTRIRISGKKKTKEDTIHEIQEIR